MLFTRRDGLVHLVCAGLPFLRAAQSAKTAHCKMCIRDRKGLDFDALQRIHEATDHIPLVLHGGTGIPADMIQKAISLGVSKINVNTECQLAFAAATRKYVEEGKDKQGKGFDPRKLLAPGVEAIKATVKEKMELFGSVGKA